MLTKTIYRIENPKTKCGMWYNERGEYEPFINTLTEGISKSLPMPFDSKFREDNIKWFSGCESLVQLGEWFSEKDIEELMESGYRLYELNVSQYKAEQFQVLYTREGIITKTEYEPEEFLSVRTADMKGRD